MRLTKARFDDMAARSLLHHHPYNWEDRRIKEQDMEMVTRESTDKFNSKAGDY